MKFVEPILKSALELLTAELHAPWSAVAHIFNFLALASHGCSQLHWLSLRESTLGSTCSRGCGLKNFVAFSFYFLTYFITWAKQGGGKKKRPSNRVGVGCGWCIWWWPLVLSLILLNLFLNISICKYFKKKKKPLFHFMMLKYLGNCMPISLVHILL